MDQPELWAMSLQAFGAVVVVLGLLAVAVQLLTTVFRASASTAASSLVTAAAEARPTDRLDDRSDDAFVHAAIHAAARQLAPDAVVSQIDAVETEERR